MKIIFALFLLLTCGTCISQNLVSNPSFEDIVQCPWYANQLNYTTDWFSASNGTPDYLNSCDTVSYIVDIPHNFWGYQVPRIGNAYTGIITLLVMYDSIYHSYREYIETKLDSSLQTGQTYFVSFYVSLADSVNYGTDDIGAYFSVDTAKSDTSFLLSVTPQIENQQGNYLTNKSGWTKISGTYVAQGGERFLTIGNFKDYLNTDTIHVSGGSSNISQSDWLTGYYYIDDVCVSTDSLNCNSSVGVQQINQPNEISLFPNPFSNQLTFTLPNNEPATIILYDILSRKPLQQTFINTTTINTEQLANGIYIYQVLNKKGTITNGKLIKQ